MRYALTGAIAGLTVAGCHPTRCTLPVAFCMHRKRQHAFMHPIGTHMAKEPCRLTIAASLHLEFRIPHSIASSRTIECHHPIVLTFLSHPLTHTRRSESSVSSTFAVVYVLVNKAWSVTGEGWTEVRAQMYRYQPSMSHKTLNRESKTGSNISSLSMFWEQNADNIDPNFSQCTAYYFNSSIAHSRPARFTSITTRRIQLTALSAGRSTIRRS
jgi:hypothetical protein